MLYMSSPQGRSNDEIRSIITAIEADDRYLYNQQQTYAQLMAVANAILADNPHSESERRQILDLDQRIYQIGQWRNDNALRIETALNAMQDSESDYETDDTFENIDFDNNEPHVRVLSFEELLTQTGCYAPAA